jgi:hypothetical protein
LFFKYIVVKIRAVPRSSGDPPLSSRVKGSKSGFCICENIMQKVRRVWHMSGAKLKARVKRGMPECLQYNS